MRDPIKILEDRVQRAVARIRELSAERSGLERDLEAARARLDSAASSRPSEESWRQEREQLVGALQEVVAELRGD